MTLSVCMIARNEHANIGRAIKSFAGLADELVVVDTGSTDDTREIARALGARVLDVPWCDDFSASRNAAVAAARGEWVFWLDCDEALLPRSQDHVRAAMCEQDVVGYSILRQDIFNEQSSAAYTEMWQQRLFRRKAASCFVGRCHPQFAPPLDTIGTVREAPGILLRHWGYLAPLRLAKLQRAAKLLELELKDRPGRFYYVVELGRTLLLMGDARGRQVMAQAAAMVDRSGASPPETMAGPLLEYLLRLPEPELPAGWTAAEVRRLAMGWFPKSVPLLTRLAKEYVSAGDFARAAELLERICALGRCGEYDKTVSFSPDLLGSGPMLNLAICYARMGELAKAQALLEPIMDCPANGSLARRNLDVVKGLREQFEEA